MTTGVVILVLAVLGSAGFAAYRSRVDGRFTPAAASPSSRPGSSSSGREERATAYRDAATKPSAATTPASDTTRDLLGHITATARGERATLLQFSSAFCAPCRATRTVLGDVAAHAEGVTHVEVDAEQHLDLVRALDVRRTPTTLILDAEGREVTRAAGVPRPAQVHAALLASSETR